MIKLLNKLLYYLKNLLLPILFAITIYIISFMYTRLGKSIFGDSLLEFLNILIPFFLLMVSWVLNIVLKQKSVQENLFYNFTSVFALTTIAVFCYRTILDKNMILWYKYNHNINFNYFSDQIIAIRILLYGLIIADVLLVLYERFVSKKVNK